MLQRIVVSVHTKDGARTVDGFIDPTVPGLALTRLPQRGWTVTHVVSGCRLTPYAPTRGALEPWLKTLGALRDWRRPLPMRNGKAWKGLQGQLLALLYPEN